MNWKDYIKSIQNSDIVGGSLETIMTDLFRKAGCAGFLPQSETVRSWLYNKRKCKSSTYFPKGTIETHTVFRYFRNKPNDKLYDLQGIFKNQIAPDSDSPIDVQTTDLDVFCWSLVNQFLDLLKFERVDIPQPESNICNKRNGLYPHDSKCCLYCVHWNDGKSIVGAPMLTTHGTCYTHSGNRHGLRPRLSSAVACENYKANQRLLSELEVLGYDVKPFI